MKTLPLTKTAQLAVIQKAIVPPPTRNEIIAALLMKAKDEHANTRADLEKRKKEALEELRLQVAHDLVKSPTIVETVAKSSASNGCNHIGLCIPKSAFSAATRKVIAKHDAVCGTYINAFDENKAKRDIAAKLNGFATESERIKSLAESPEIAALYGKLIAAKA